MDNDPKDICFDKAEGNLLKFLYSLPLRKFSWHSHKEMMESRILSSGNCQAYVPGPY